MLKGITEYDTSANLTRSTGSQTGHAQKGLVQIDAFERLFGLEPYFMMPKEHHSIAVRMLNLIVPGSSEQRAHV